MLRRQVSIPRPASRDLNRPTQTAVLKHHTDLEDTRMRISFTIHLYASTL